MCRPTIQHWEQASDPVPKAPEFFHGFLGQFSQSRRGTYVDAEGDKLDNHILSGGISPGITLKKQATLGGDFKTMMKFCGGRLKERRQPVLNNLLDGVWHRDVHKFIHRMHAESLLWTSETL